MSEFEELLGIFMDARKVMMSLNLKKATMSTLSEAQRIKLWNYVNNYVKGISSRQFKQSNYGTKGRGNHLDAHEQRVFLFYDFVDFAVKRGKGARWVLRVFKLRFSWVEAAAEIRRNGVVNIDEAITKNGFNHRIVKRYSRIAAAQRECSKKLQRYTRSFEEVAPCLCDVSSSSKQVVDNWRTYYNYFNFLDMFSNPLPLESYGEFENV